MDLSMIISLIVIFFVLFTRQSGKYLRIIQNKKKGRKRSMPTELIKEFIGKVCNISLFNDSFGVMGKIVAVEDNWIKINEKSTVRLINGDMVRDIKIMPDKYQK